MTITAAHEYSIEPFIESLKTCTESVRNKNIQNRDKSINDVSRISFNPEELNSLVAAISHSLSTPDEDSGSQMTLINQLIRTMPSELVEKLFKTIVNEVFTPTRKDEKDN
jgi:hypothetical protein